MKKNLSFRSRLAIVVVGAALVPMALSFLLHMFIHYQSLYQESYSRQVLTAKYVASEIRGHLEGAEYVLKGLDEYQTFAHQSPARMQELMSSTVFGQLLFHSITYFDAQGVERITVSRQSVQPLQRHRQIIDQTIGEEPSQVRLRYSPVYYDHLTAEPMISTILSLVDPQTDMVEGYLIADLMLRPVWDHIAQINFEGNANVFVIDAQDQVIAHRDPSVVLRRSQFDYLPNTVVQPGQMFSTSIMASKTMMLGKHPYQIIVERARSVVLSPMLDLLWISMLVLAVALPFVLLVARELHHYLLIPIRGVTEAAARIQEGDFSTRIAYAGSDEIGLMIRAFNDMSARLTETIDTLEGEQSLRASLIDNLPDIITIKDQDLKLVDFNKAFIERVGQPKEALFGKSLPDIYDEDTAAILSTYDGRVLKTGEAARFEYHIKWRDGETQYFDSIKVPLKSPNGEITGLISVSRDITKYNEVLDSLRKSEREFRLAIAKSPLPIALTKANGDIEYFNPKFVETFGWTQDDIVTAADWWDAAYPDIAYRKRVLDGWQIAIAEAQEKDTEIDVQQWRLTCKDASEREAEFRMVPLTSDRHLIVINDITERMMVEKELKHHRDHLEELVVQRTGEAQEKTIQLEAALEREKEFNTLQQKFVALVSHEFRTPLTIIDGAAQRLIRRKGKFDAEEVEARAHKMRSAVTRMIGLIDTTLYASRLDAGKIEVRRTSSDIGELLLDVCERQAEISPEHQFNIDVDNLPSEMLIDNRLIDQVFTNLLSNAVKYAPNDPYIEVTGEQDNGDAVITVIDHGVGIPAEDLPHMFGRFFRAATAEGIKGTGLGLSVCKEFVELHGGNISVDSTAGEGTTFTIRLPIDAEGS